MTNWAHHTWNSNMCKRNGFILGLLAATFFLTMSSSVSYARPKSLGATFSFTGFALSYEHELERYNSFIEASLKAETSELFLYRADLPGVSGTVTWNIQVKEWLSAEGNRLTFFAGPGIIAGYGYDYKMPQGVFFGLKGRIGIECNFYRNVVISAFVSPVIGSHVEMYNDHLMMRYYRQGIAYALVPEIGIKYRF